MTYKYRSDPLLLQLYIKFCGLEANGKGYYTITQKKRIYDEKTIKHPHLKRWGIPYKQRNEDG